jgi:predicted O-methyltransferase YrrM
LDYPKDFLNVNLGQWHMQTHDAPIFKYIYKNFSPKRHLEFGTWQGEGTIMCLESCDATVWTVNLYEGETRSNGEWAYGEEFSQVHNQANDKNTQVISINKNKSKIYHRTDAFGFIGRYYLEKSLGHRVCQIYSDSTVWDTSNYPHGFFDTILIDGGHTYDVVVSDTMKSIPLVRSGGIVMWHDYCPDSTVLSHCSAPRGVCSAILDMYPTLKESFSELFWVYPSWILVGIKK